VVGVHAHIGGHIGNVGHAGDAVLSHGFSLLASAGGPALADPKCRSQEELDVERSGLPQIHGRPER
jgi:hypothetical protein